MSVWSTSFLPEVSQLGTGSSVLDGPSVFAPGGRRRPVEGRDAGGPPPGLMFGSTLSDDDGSMEDGGMVPPSFMDGDGFHVSGP
jgi:hypothetical protein